MPHKEDGVRLGHMLEAAREAMAFARGRTRAELGEDRPLMHSLVRLLPIIGEAANQVSPEGQQRIPGVPWPDIIGMRNRLVHAYHDVNLTIVWRTVTEDLPPLIAVLETALSCPPKTGEGGPRPDEEAPEEKQRREPE